MGILGLLGDLPRALKAGEQLSNPETYHSAANTGTALLVVFNVLVEVPKQFGYDLHIDPSTLDSLAKGISGIAVAVIAVIHTASSKDAGFK